MVSSLFRKDFIMSKCACGSGLDFDQCCGPIIGGSPAPSAEALLRARYVAFCDGNMDFLAATLAPEKMEDFERAEVEASAKEAKAQFVEVRRVNDQGDVAEIEYVAYFRINNQPHAHHELGLFRRDDGKWLYVDGQVNPKTAPRQVEKVGRNDPCPCGSGNKYKKCCGA